MAFLEVEHLKYRYPHTKKLALDDISFTAEKGEFIGIIGENGAGKSTLSQAFCGLVPQFYKGAYGGKVTVDGIAAATTPTAELCKKVGLIFQNPFNQLSGAKDTVWDEVAFGLENFGVPTEQIHERLDKVLHQLDIWQFREKNPFDLSGGQMQRVAIASVLAMEPEILLLDEPTSQLDPQGSEEVFHTVELLAKTGITIFMIEQKMEKLASYCDRILLLHEGKQIAFDTPEKIFSRSDLADLGICPPYATRYCKEQNILRPNGTYPVTVDDVQKVLKAGIDKVAALPQLADPVYRNVAENRFTVNDLHFSYTEDHPIFEGFRLSLDQRPTAIIGQNGAGKTTTIGMLSTLLLPTSGEIWINGELLTRQKNQLKQKLSVVTQEYSMRQDMTMNEIMEYQGRLYYMPIKKIRERSEELLEFCGLIDYRKRTVRKLSGGMKRKLMVCRALLTEPEILLLDEPTAGMDAFARRQMWNLLKKLNQQKLTILLTTHYMEEAETLCDRVGFMCGGRLEETDAPGHMIEMLGRYAVDETSPDGLKSHYFHGKEEAIQYLSASEQETALRSTTLEDVFLETIGQQLECR